MSLSKGPTVVTGGEEGDGDGSMFLRDPSQYFLEGGPLG